MADKFTLSVDVASLLAVEKVLAEIGAQCAEEGAKLAAKPGEATDWTGHTATTLKTAMATLAADMRQAAPHFHTAVAAVRTFRQAVQQAQTQLPGLNRAWAQSESTYTAAVTQANDAYDTAKSTSTPQDWGTAEADAGRTRDDAKTTANANRATTQNYIGTSWSTLHDDLETKAKACGAALATAVSRSVPPNVVRGHLDGHGAFYPFDATSYLTGASPFPSPVTQVVQRYVDRGILPPGSVTWSLAQLQAYLKAHPDVARRLVQSAPQKGGQTSPETQLALALVGYDPNATGAKARQQREKFRSVFETLSPRDQALLATLFPSQTGNTGGVPFAARSAGNYVSIVVANDDVQKKLAELKAKLAGVSITPSTGRGAVVVYGQRQKLLDEIDALTKQSHTYQRVIDDPSHLVVLFDAQHGRYAEASGPIGPSTRNVAVIVPGTGTTMGSISGNVKTYDGFAQQSNGSLVTITWMGGALPQDLLTDSPFPRFSTDLGPRAAEFTHEVRQEIDSSQAVDNHVKITLVGHSYGGAIVGVAETKGADVDRALYVEAGGMGHDVKPSDQNDGPNVRRYSMTAPGDLMGYFQGVNVGRIGLGADPDDWPGTTRLETGYYADGSKVEGMHSHGGVFKAGSDSWRQIYEVMTGGTVTTAGGNEPRYIQVANVSPGPPVYVKNPDYHPPQYIDIP